MEQIPTPTVGEILKEEFMEPLNISAYRVAKEIDVPTSRIQDILHNRRQITVDTSIRLGRLFGVSDRYFLNMQNDIDIRNAEEKSGNEFDKIKTIPAS
ncbi:HigA family addiction module antitoxin [Limosilactobacillus vaginalis]